MLSVLFSLYRYSETELVERIDWKLIENGYEKLKLMLYYWELWVERDDEEGLVAMQHLAFIIASLFRSTRQGLQTFITANLDVNQVKCVLQQWLSSLGDEAVTGSDLRTVLPNLVQILP